MKKEQTLLKKIMKMIGYPRRHSSVTSPANKTSAPKISIPCMVFVVMGTNDVGDWMKMIVDFLRNKSTLTTKLAKADVILVIVGLGESFRNGTELNTPQLIRHALKQGKTIIPVSVNDARIPEDLPDEISYLSTHQAVTIAYRYEIPGILARLMAKHRPPGVGGHNSPNSIRMRSGPMPNASFDSKKIFMFVCYRRDDSGYWAEVLAKALASKVGGGQVFLDIGSQYPGRDYRDQIANALSQSTHFILLIGPGFLALNAMGIRRIDESHDQVKMEILSALAGKKKIYIVLTGNTNMPKRCELPIDINKVTSTKFISRLQSEQGATLIADEIVYGHRRKTPLKGLSALYAKNQLEWQDLHAYAYSIMISLASHGWNVVSQHYDDGECFTLENSRYPSFRFEVQALKSEVLLQEHVQRSMRLGFHRWITQFIFSISPLTHNMTDLLQLPTDLLEAALEPNHYLNRIGRFNITKRERQKDISWHDRLRGFQLTFQTNPIAVEAYQQTRQCVSASGGLTRLVPHSRVVDIPHDIKGHKVAFHPDGSKMVVISDDGIHIINNRVPDDDGIVRFYGSFSSVSFSRQGRLAVGSDKGRIWIWDIDGSPIDVAKTPYSLMRRALAQRAKEKIEFATISWSDGGNELACCAEDAMWIYHIESQQFKRWEFPQGHSGFQFNHYGASFIRGSNDILVYGRLLYLWLLRRPTLQVHKVLELEQHPITLKLIFNKDRTEEPSTRQAFSTIYSAEPSPQGNIVACAGSHGQVAIYNLKSLEQVTILAWHKPFPDGMENEVKAVSFSPDGQWLASIARDGELVVGNTCGWEPKRFARVANWSGRFDVAWSPDSKTIAVTGLGHIKLWSM